MRVSGAKLLENGFEHLGLLLDYLTKLLELGIVAEEIQIAEVAITAALSCECGGGSRSCLGVSATATSSGPASAALSSEIKQIYVPIIIASLLSSCCGRCGWGSSLPWLLWLLLKIFGDTLWKRKWVSRRVLGHSIPCS